MNNTNNSQPTYNGWTLPEISSGATCKAKLLLSAVTHNEGTPKTVQTAIILPKDMVPIFKKIVDYLFATAGVEFLTMPLDDLTPRQRTARLRFVKIGMLMKFFEEHPNMFTPMIATAVTLGIDLMGLAETDQDSVLDDLLRVIHSTVDHAASRGARSGAKGGVKDAFRERDKKSRKNKDKLKEGQYDSEDWDKVFDEVTRRMKLPGAKIGETLAAVHSSKGMTKVTFDRFRRKWYEVQEEQRKARKAVVVK